MKALPFEVHASDPTLYLVLAALLLGVAVAACWMPSRRAARSDPIQALRDGGRLAD